jgi:hypothetical protein
MSAIRMTHPLHGAMHAYDAAEIEKLKGWGWSVEGDAEKAPVEIGVDAEIPKKRGRPPKAK